MHVDVDILLTHPNYLSSEKALHVNEIADKKDYIYQNKKSPKSLLQKLISKLISDKFLADTLTFGESRYTVRRNFNNK